MKKLNPDGENLAAVLISKRNIIIKKLNDPILKENHVRVKIVKSAICGTQIGEWAMNRGIDHFLPHCLGHEAVGYIIEIGEKITKFSVGDRVIVSWMKNINNKQDDPPIFYEKNTNQLINFGECCTFVTRGVFPENRVYKIDNTITNNTAALLGCAFLTAYSAIKLATKDFTNVKNKIAIIGAGGVGLATAILAESYNIECICVDISKVITELKKINSKIEFIDIESIKKYYLSFNTVIICTGNKDGFELAQNLLHKNSGNIFIVGNPPYGEKIGIEIKALLYGRKIIGVGEKDLQLPLDLMNLIELVKIGKLDAEKLIRKTYSMSDIQEAFEFNETGMGGRILIDIDI